jgi:FAD-dependent urate hydroxylase
VLGAGPYGLSVAAHLRSRGLPVTVFGRPMGFWRAMPRAMFLKSPWSASHLSDPSRRYDLEHFATETGCRAEPLPLSYFLEYADWFRRSAVGGIDERLVRCVRREAGGFRLELDDGTSTSAARVVVATGVDRFTHVPGFAATLPSELAFHAQNLGQPERYAGERVAVLGRGQSALEWAVLLREAGAEVELIARGPVRWVDRRFAEVAMLRRLLYAPSDVGPAGLSRLVAMPMLFRRLPDQRRQAWTIRSIRPAGAGWLEPRFTGITTTEGAGVAQAVEQGGRLHLLLSDGSRREVDRLVMATGYRPELARLDFLDSAMVAQVRQQDGFPILDTTFQTSVPGLHVVGALGSFTFGPLCRFVAGAPVAARQVARAA